MAPSLQITESRCVDMTFGCLHADKVLYLYTQHRTTKQRFNLNNSWPDHLVRNFLLVWHPGL